MGVGVDDGRLQQQLRPFPVCMGQRCGARIGLLKKMLTLPAVVFLLSSGERDRDCCSLKHVLIDHEPFLLCTDAQSLPCSVDSGGVCSDVVCPGDVVTYTCDVTAVMGSTVWRFPTGTCTDDAIALAQTIGCAAATGMCDPFDAANQPADGVFGLHPHCHCITGH